MGASTAKPGNTGPLADRPHGVDVDKARRWFKVLAIVAVLAMGALYRAIQAPSGASAGLTVLVSSLVLAASVTQAARIVLVLNGPARLPGRPNGSTLAWRFTRRARNGRAPRA
jgi:hypothetical protein